MASPVWVQEDWRYGYDDGAINANTWYSAGNNVAQTIAEDTVYRLRFVVQQTNAAKDVNNQIHELWASYKGGAYFQVTSASTYVQLTNDTQGIADHATTSQVIGDGTYETGPDREGWDDGTTDDDTGVCDGSGGEEMELEFCIIHPPADVANGDTVDFECRLNGGTQYNQYLGTRPRTTISAAAAAVFAYVMI
jgi:hypothetical protein